MNEWRLEDALVVERQEGWEDGREYGWGEGREEGREEGIEEGIERNKLTIARNALTKGIPLEMISSLTGLDTETIERLSRNNEQ